MIRQFTNLVLTFLNIILFHQFAIADVVLTLDERLSNKLDKSGMMGKSLVLVIGAVGIISLVYILVLKKKKG